MTTTDKTESAVRDRAYQIWEASGRPFGDADTHWFQAVQELETSPAMTTPEPGVKAKANAKKATGGAKKARTSKNTPARGSAKKSAKK